MRPPSARVTFRCAPPISKPATMLFSFSTLQAFMKRADQLAGKALRIIPVLDLKGGEVVRAEMGRRDRYRPIVTPLSASSDPVSVAAGLRTLYPFPAFYIADLDAIEGRAPNTGALARLRAMPDAPELWVDAGIADGEALAAALAEPSLRPVLGSESQSDDALLRRFRDHPGLILSLDFFADGFRGPPSILEEPAVLAAKRDRHDAGQGRFRRRSGFRAACADQGEGWKPLRHRRRRRAQRSRYPRAFVARRRRRAGGDVASRRHAHARRNLRRSAPDDEIRHRSEAR